MDYLDKLNEAAMAQPGYVGVWEPYRVMGALVDERVRLGLTQREVAEELGTSQAVIARMENDPSRVSFARVLRYAEVVGVPIHVGPGTHQPKKSDRRGRKSKLATAM